MRLPGRVTPHHYHYHHYKHLRLPDQMTTHRRAHRNTQELLHVGGQRGTATDDGLDVATQARSNLGENVLVAKRGCLQCTHAQRQHF